MKEADVRGTLKNASKGVCTSTFVISPDPLSSIPPTSSAIKTAEDVEEDPNNPEGDSDMEYSSDSCAAPSILYLLSYSKEQSPS